METLIFFSLSVLLFVVSIQLFRNKWLMLLAGYNTLSKDERNKIDIKPYVKVIVWNLASAGAVLLAYGIGSLKLEVPHVYLTTLYVLTWSSYIISLINLLRFAIKHPHTLDAS